MEQNKLFRKSALEKLAIKNEILSQGLACAEAVAGDDLAKRLLRAAQGPSARNVALSAAIRIAAAIGLGSARSWPAMSKAVP